MQGVRDNVVHVHPSARRLELALLRGVDQCVSSRAGRRQLLPLHRPVSLRVTKRRARGEERGSRGEADAAPSPGAAPRALRAVVPILGGGMRIVPHLGSLEKRIRAVHLGGDLVPRRALRDQGDTVAFGGCDCLDMAGAAATPPPDPARRNEIEAAYDLCRYPGHVAGPVDLVDLRSYRVGGQQVAGRVSGTAQRLVEPAPMVVRHGRRDRVQVHLVLLGYAGLV
eukprot:7376045-Prymnesium_polylepis.2